MTEFNNPASRLYELLKGLSEANRNLPTSAVLADVLGVENTPKNLMRGIVKFHDLVREVKEYATEKTPLPTAPLERYIPQIESAVDFTNLDAPWNNYYSRITPACLVTLEMIGQVETAPQDKIIPVEELSLLEESLRELFNEVEVESTLDKEFKAFVLRQIEEIRRAISEFRISGASGFKRYVETLILESVQQSEVLIKAKDENPATLDKLKTIVNKVCTFATCASDGLKALEKISGTYSTVVQLLPKL